MDKVSVAAYIRPMAPNPDIKSNSPVGFITPKKMELTTTAPILKAAFVLLGEAMPHAIPYPDLCQKVQQLVHSTSGPMSASDRKELAARLLNCYQRDVTELHVYSPPVAKTISERPLASPLARLQAASGSGITNRRHRVLALDPQDVIILKHLDGTRDRIGLHAALVEAVESGSLKIKDKEGNSPSPEVIGPLLDQALDHAFYHLLQASVLVA